MKNYSKENKKKQIEKQRIYYKNNREHILKLRRKNRLKHKDRENLKNRVYTAKNRERYRRIHTKSYHKNKYKNKSIPQVILMLAIRKRVWSTLRRKKTYKNNKTIELLGCDINTLKNHLESKFKKGMTWKNYGFYGWHIDHIRPCSSFDLTKESEQKKCFNYKNLQPLWAKDNLSKHAKLDWDNPKDYHL